MRYDQLSRFCPHYSVIFASVVYLTSKHVLYLLLCSVSVQVPQIHWVVCLSCYEELG